MNRFSQTIAKAVRGNQAALEFLAAFHQIIEVWDDLIDKDNQVSDVAINAAFHIALISLPRNPFYREHFNVINPVIDSAILDWLAANELEKSTKECDLREAYVLRCSCLSVTVQCAKIIGGVEWAASINHELRSLPDQWPEYAAKHRVQ